MKSNLIKYKEIYIINNIHNVSQFLFLIKLLISQ